MGGPAQIWAARSADTNARLTRAAVRSSRGLEASQPHQAISSHAPPAPELPKTTLIIGPAEGISRACLGGPQRSLCGLVSGSDPGDVCSVSGSQSGPSRLPSRNPPTNFLPARLQSFPASLPLLLLFPCLEHRSPSSPSSPFLPLPSPAQGPPQPNPSIIMHPQVPHRSRS